MMKITKFSLLLLVLGMAAFTGCGDDSEPAALAVTAITATGTAAGDPVTKDLNGRTSAEDVPVDAEITVEFSSDVDATTATTSTITLNDGTNDAAVAVSTVGKKVMITPAADLKSNTTYTLEVTNALTSSDGGAFVAITRTFKTDGNSVGVVPRPEKLVVFLPFTGAVLDEKGHTILNANVSFGDDRLGTANASAIFNGTTDYVGVEYGADMSNASTTVSYWIKFPESADHMAHIGTTSTSVTNYVTFSMGGNNGTYHEWIRFTCCDFGYDLDALKYFTNHVNSGSASVLAGSALEMKNEGNPGGDKIVEVNNKQWLEKNTGKWMHLVTSWDAGTRTKSFYVNGVPSTVFTLTPSAEYVLDAAIIDTDGIALDATNNSNLYLGSGVPYWASIDGDGIKPFRNDKAFAFKGQMDEFRMYSVALTDAEVESLYNAEKP